MTSVEEQHEGRPDLQEVLSQLEEVIREAVPPGEVVVHFDVLVETRVGPEARQIRFRRFSPPGSDPLVSLGLLSAMKARLRHQLGIGGAAG